jgi:spore coat-associated protein N
MKKIVGLTIVVLLLAGMAGIGTWAFFSDIETSTGNTLTAGTLNLKTNDADGVTQTLMATNMAPGDTVGPQSITLKNSGSVAGTTLGLSFSYTESDGSPNAVNMSADETAAKIEVTTLSYDGSSLLSSVIDNNSNGYKDVQDLKNASLSSLGGIGAGASKIFQIGVQLRADTGNDFQADGITVTMTFVLNQ